MNKQVAIAGLLGATQAAECADQFTKYTSEVLAALEEHKAELAQATAGLEEAVELEEQAVEGAVSALEAQMEIMSPFAIALEEAATAFSAESEASQFAASAISALGAENTANSPLGDAKQALDDAEGLMNTAQENYDEQSTAVTKLLNARTEHDAEVITLTTALETAEQAEETAIEAYADAEGVQQAYVDERAEAVTGQAAILVTKTEEYTTAEEAYTADEGEESSAFETYKPAKKAYDMKVKEIAMIDAACAFGPVDMSGALGGTNTQQLNCDTQTDDPIKALKTAADGGLGALETTWEEEEELWEGKVDDCATTQTAEMKALAWKQIATTNDEAIEGLATGENANVESKLEAKEEATEDKETAESDLSTAETQKANAHTDLTRGEDILDDLMDVLTPLKDDYVVKTYLLQVQRDKEVEETAIKAAADALLSDLEMLEEMAEETVDRAQLAVDFYTERLGEAGVSYEVAAEMLGDNLWELGQTDEAIEEATDAARMAVANCKANGYRKAQDALRAKLDREAEEDDIIEEVKEEYDVQSALPAAGVIGALCNYTVRTSLDEDVGERPLCNEGLCCGAAQKFMKDGTKLAIETCQNPTTRTYTYYPPLPDRAVVAPATETWRFQCISGAQKLVAAATAALAAGYMMA